MNMVYFFIIAVGAYFVGGIPFGFLYAKMRGVDIRTVGSGNIGATNVARQFGFLGGFVPVFLLDVLKGAAPVLTMKLLNIDFLEIFSGSPSGDVGKDLAMLVAGIVVILGNMFPIYLKFKGGKGVATSAGVFLSLATIPGLASLGVFLVVFFITMIWEKKGIVAIASMVAGFSLPFTIHFLYPDHIVIFILGVVVAVLFVFSHRSNIAKMIKGEKLEKKSE